MVSANIRERVDTIANQLQMKRGRGLKAQKALRQKVCRSAQYIMHHSPASTFRGTWGVVATSPMQPRLGVVNAPTHIVLLKGAGVPPTAGMGTNAIVQVLGRPATVPEKAATECTFKVVLPLNAKNTLCP